ncbi:hypothetical protein I302_105620 [Kwoniella bestiolae CBS 10118]|uniref:Uncharacterized protein n=1 Tax=Kwoniella bestiolae CBS 10118 TaxID=1296100 RepID=A0A1B9G1N5_9TREE|nr:hypothetical protein I302_04739 [Kwoniella bestiolae CBS 10118]OCF24929.1 hypothetical protein I302_04739 [Kwoniella bestiolae CBS 10118]
MSERPSYQAAYNDRDTQGRSRLSNYVTTITKHTDKSLDNVNTLYSTGFYKGESAAKILMEHNDHFHQTYSQADPSIVLTLARQCVEGAHWRLKQQEEKKSKRMSRSDRSAPRSATGIHVSRTDVEGMPGQRQESISWQGNQSWPCGSLNPDHHQHRQQGHQYGHQVPQFASESDAPSRSPAAPPPPQTDYGGYQATTIAGQSTGSYGHAHPMQESSPALGQSIVPPNYNQVPAPPNPAFRLASVHEMLTQPSRSNTRPTDQNQNQYDATEQYEDDARRREWEAAYRR